ncbi:MAG: tetratricopeptide repeat protein [Pseudomonadota bacterium]
MINVSLQNFESEVIAASASTPVLLDIWAEWCGPCKALGPVLEKLEAEYAGRFILAKVDADAEPEIAGQLSQMFGVRSIPFCVMFAGGQPVDGFVGALPEKQIRAFLDKHVPSVDAIESEEDLIEAEELAAHGDADSAVAKLQAALQADAGNDEARFELIKLLLAAGRVADAQAAFEPVATRASGPLAEPRVAAFGRYVEAAQQAAQARPLEQLQATIAANKRDFDARFELAQVHFAAGRFTEAMDELLEILMRDKKWADERARLAYVAILEVMTRPQPRQPAKAAGAEAKPTLELAGKTAVVSADPLLDQYRRKLSMALF